MILHTILNKWKPRKDQDEHAKPCAYCNEPHNLDIVKYGDGTIVVKCKTCGAHGPEARNRTDSILLWNTANNQIKTIKQEYHEKEIDNLIELNSVKDVLKEKEDLYVEKCYELDKAEHKLEKLENELEEMINALEHTLAEHEKALEEISLLKAALKEENELHLEYHSKLKKTEKRLAYADERQERLEQEIYNLERQRDEARIIARYYHRKCCDTHGGN